jgi:hypothetical protein
MEMAPGLVGATRDSCRTFIAHFLRHWPHRKEAFDDVIEAFTEMDHSAHLTYIQAAAPLAMMMHCSWPT